MKKFLAVLALAGVLTLTGCCCGKKSKSSHKKSHYSKDTKKATMKKASVKKAPTKNTGAVKSELDKIWDDVANMWVDKKHYKPQTKK